VLPIFNDYHKKFRERLRFLRKQKGVDANEMSESLGLHETYISKIETKRGMPSFDAFFYICQYLEVTPKDFFDFDLDSPSDFLELFEDYKQLDEKQAAHAKALIKALLINQTSEQSNKKE